MFAMKYEAEFKPRAIKDCRHIDKNILKTIFAKIDMAADGLKGDVKRLTNFTPEYRLRSGDYRILFEIEDNKIIVYRIRHRREVYD